MIIPIVSLDKIYIKPDEKNIFFLDCTRVSGTDEIISRKKESLDSQIKRISNNLICKKIILADDVVFSGGVLTDIINRFSSNGVKVVKIISSVCTENGFNKFSKMLDYGIQTCFIMANDVIDQICERDFYFGVAGSGIMTLKKNGYYKAPYFKPYGNPCERASIPVEFEKYFSIGCLERSIYLWNDIDKVRDKKTIINELPEKIVNTNDQDEVVKTLKKELKRI